MVEGLVEAVKLDSVMFSLFKVKEKMVHGSVVFMLSWPCLEKTALDGSSATGREEVLVGPHNLKELFGLRVRFEIRRLVTQVFQNASYTLTCKLRQASVWVDLCQAESVHSYLTGIIPLRASNERAQTCTNIHKHAPTCTGQPAHAHAVCLAFVVIISLLNHGL